MNLTCPALLALALLGGGLRGGGLRGGEDPQGWRLENAGEHELAPAVYAFETRVEGRFAVRAGDRDLPAAYDDESGTLLVWTAVPTGGLDLVLHAGERSRARLPKWKRPRVDREPRPAPGLTPHRRRGAVLENGVLRVEVPIDERVHGRVELELLEGDLGAALYPLGSSVGCAATREIGEDVESRRRSGATADERLFHLFPSVVTEVEILEPNPFQRVLRAEAVEFHAGGAPEGFRAHGELGYELELTHGSPVVRLRTWRLGGQPYFNHNGVYLNELAFEARTVRVATDDEPEGRELATTGGARELAVGRAFGVEFDGGWVIVDQPDFADLGIYRAGVFFHGGRVLSVLSQSWGEGWKPIEIPGSDREDSLSLVLVPGRSPKGFRAWLDELGVPAGD